MTHSATTRAVDSEVTLLRALVLEQLAQITDLTQRLAEAQIGASADPHVLRAIIEALERRLQDSRALTLAREATLVEQILTDGAELQALAAERDRDSTALDQQRQAAERQISELNRHIVAIETERRAAIEEAATLRLDLNRVHTSHSWKLTEPLRAVRRLLKRQE